MKKNTGIIRIKNAVFYAYHGVLSDEQSLGGKFEVDVEIKCDFSKSIISDGLEDTVNYERVYDYIKNIINAKKHFLLESLSATICNGILKNFKQAISVSVKIRKPNAPVKGVVDFVEVEFTKNRR